MQLYERRSNKILNAKTFYHHSDDVFASVAIEHNSDVCVCNTVEEVSEGMSREQRRGKTVWKEICNKKEERKKV